jgi:hypothetical protein
MLKVVLISMAVLSASVSNAAIAAPSDADCKVAWSKADKNNDGSVSGSEATAYLAAIKKSGKSYDDNNDGKLSQAEFLKACKDGVFAAIK